MFPGESTADRRGEALRGAIGGFSWICVRGTGSRMGWGALADELGGDVVIAAYVGQTHLAAFEEESELAVTGRGRQGDKVSRVGGAKKG